MKTYKSFLLFSTLAIFVLLLGACGPTEGVSFITGGECPPGYVPVYDEQIGSAGSCQLNPNPPLTMEVPTNGKCPPGYHRVYYLEFPQFDYCELDPTPTPQFQAPNPNLSDLKPVQETVSMAANGKCPPGYVPVYDEQIGSPGSCQLDPSPPLTMEVPTNGKCPPGYHKVTPGDVSAAWYCELDATPTPPVQAPNSGVPDLKPDMQVVQYCANQGANLGGVNITFPLDKTLHVDEWFSENSSHVKCTDDVSNPRTCWGPQSTSFEVLLCSANLGQNQNSLCKSLPVTLGACRQKKEDDDPAEPVVPACPRGRCSP